MLEYLETKLEEAKKSYSTLATRVAQGERALNGMKENLLKLAGQMDFLIKEIEDQKEPKE